MVHRNSLSLVLGCSAFFGLMLCAAALGSTHAAAASTDAMRPTPISTPLNRPAQVGPAPLLPASASTPPAIRPGAFPPNTSTPVPGATPVPLLVEPSTITTSPSSIVILRTQGVFGALSAVSANPQIARATADQNQRTIRIDTFAIGTTVITVSDQRGTTRQVPLTVEPLAGTIGFVTSTRVTGAPASALFVAEAAQAAALAVAEKQPNVTAVVNVANLHSTLLNPDEITDLRVPLTLSGPGYIPVNGLTIVHVENVAQPSVNPASLIVSDFPERLTASGLLFTSDLNTVAPTRLLFYHYNPKGQPDRHIVLRVHNSGDVAAQLQVIDGHGGPSGNEMLVGHSATERFLVRSQQNEGTLISIPPASTAVLVDAALPAGTIVNDMMQIREITGAPLSLRLTAEDGNSLQTGAAFDESTTYLTAAEHHARGVYPIPHFYYETTYAVGAPPVAIPVGQLPLPNLRQGEALVGDYGVQLTIDAALSNSTNEAVPIALYANPRGGRATGTFLIDRTLVRAHALKSFSNYKLRQYLIPPHGVINVQVVTMPEGGSSYPLNLIFAPDDGSVAPGAPGSPVY